MIKKIIVCLMAVMLFGYCKSKKQDNSGLGLLAALQMMSQNATIPRTTCLDSATGTDTFYDKQWHLNNDGSLPNSVAGEDAKVQAVWTERYYGDNVLVAVVDDGLENAHEDLTANISTAVLGYNYENSSNDPTPTAGASAHGTSVGGVIAARAKNGKGVSGAAPCAQLTGRAILGAGMPGTASLEAMTRDIDKIWVSNNSWGAADNTGETSTRQSTWEAAIESGLSTGRNGKGTIYLFAAGNGNNPTFSSGCDPFNFATCWADSANFDGQSNFYGVLTIGGIGTNGKKASYSEDGSSLWIVAHTQGNTQTTDTDAIVTADRSGEDGSNNAGSPDPKISDTSYTSQFNGTSSATPLAAGVVALLVGAYPDLGWRDVREILASSARKNDGTHTDWATNRAGYNINHVYGFGAADAAAHIEKAKTWTKITSPLVATSEITIPQVPVTANGSANQTVTIDGTNNAGISKIEHVEVIITIAGGDFGKMDIKLSSPGTSPTESFLIRQHTCYDTTPTATVCTSTLTDYSIGSNRHLGENPDGTWTLTVVDNGSGATTVDAKIKFRGRAN